MVVRIRTTHAGSLPRTPAVAAADRRFSAGQMSPADHAGVIRDGVTEVVRRQCELGLDIVNDGEYTHRATSGKDFSSWCSYIDSRLSGLRAPDPADINLRRPEGADRRDRWLFAEAYADPESGCLDQGPGSLSVVTGPVTYTGQDTARQDAEHLASTLDALGHSRADAFISSVSPGAAARRRNHHYRSDAEMLAAYAEALHEEYRTITDQGFTVQIDAPDIADYWDAIDPEPTIVEYRAWVRVRVDALNFALQGIPRDQVRLHVCWGSWPGPHTTDIPFGAILTECLRADAAGLAFEAASPRHEHEWRVWSEYQLPEDTVILPGVVSHTTNVVEHPRLVADRILRFADLVGPENVIATTDCGLGGRLHPQIAWAKLASLVEGAALASQSLHGN